MRLRIRPLSRIDWLSAGLAVGMVVAPGAAVAASVLITQGNGPAADTTNANQSLSAEAPPADWVSIHGWNASAGSCANLPVVSRSKAFIVRQADVVMSGGNAVYTVWLYEGAGCRDGSVITEAEGNGSNVVVPLTPGIALGRGQQLSLRFTGPPGGVDVDVLGYTVPSSDAPASTPIKNCSTSASGCGHL